MDDRTHLLLERSVANLEPTHGLEDVKGRARQRHTRARIFAGVLAAIVALVGVGGGIAILSEDRSEIPIVPGPPSSQVSSQRIAELRAELQRARLRVSAVEVRVQRDLHALEIARLSGSTVKIQEAKARLELDRVEYGQAVAAARHVQMQLRRLLVVSSAGGPGTLAGVPFPVCEPMSMSGAFGPGLDTAWVFARASDSGCDAADARFVGVGTRDSVAFLSEPLLDDDLRGTELWPFAAADLNGDGLDEIAIGAVPGGETPTRFALFRIESAGIARITWCVDCGALVDWSGPASGVQGSYEGALCQEQDGSPVFTTWNVELSDDRTRLNGWSIDYALQGLRFEEVGRRKIDIPAEATGRLPVGGGPTLCGSRVNPTP